MRNAHFYVIAQRVAVTSYRRFRTAYRSQFQGSILHVVDSEINESAVSSGSSHMTESCGPRSSSSSPPPPRPASFLLLLLLLLLLLRRRRRRRRKQSAKGKMKDKNKKWKDPLFLLCFLPSLLQLPVSSHYLSVFLWILLQQKENKDEEDKPYLFTY